MPPTVLAQPNGSSIFFRCFWDSAYPSCRVVRPSIAEYLDFWATWGMTQAWRRSDTNPVASYPLSAPSVSRRVDPGGMVMDHVQRRLALGMTVSLGQITLHDKPVPVFHQRMAH